jgi:hypothetical protein
MSTQSPPKVPITKTDSALAALIFGWAAAVLPLAIATLFDEPAALIDSILGHLMLTGTLVVPCWFLVAVPLFIFLRPDSDFWRSWVSIPFGAIIGTILSSSFYHAIAYYPSHSPGTVLTFALSGAASGGTMLGILSRRNLPHAEIKLSGLIAVILAVPIQILLVGLVWNRLMDISLEMGRPLPVGVQYGLSIYYSYRLLGLGVLVASIVSASTQRAKIRWLTIGGILLGWIFWTLPMLEGRPIRGSTFMILGGTILCLGSGFLVPILGQMVERLMRHLQRQGSK